MTELAARGRSAPMRCPTSPSARGSAGTSRRSAPTGPRPLAPTLFQLPQDHDLRRLERDPEEHHRQGDPGTVKRMDFDLSEEQRLLEETVERLMSDATASSSARATRPRPTASAASCGRDTPSSACSACRSPRSMAASAAVGGRDHDRDGGLRPRPRARALSRDGRARRRACLRTPAAPRRSGDPAADRRRQAHACLRPYRAAVALRPGRCRDAARSATAPAGCSTARRASSCTATAPTS